MRVLLTSAGLETEKIQDFFVKLMNMDMSLVKALFIPTAAMDADAVAVLPKCMNDLLKCGIPAGNVTVYDMHWGMDLEELKQYDVIYLCGGSTRYLLGRMKETGFGRTLMAYIHADGVVLGVSAGSIIFANNLPDNLGLIDTKLDVHCEEGEPLGQTAYPLKDNIRLTNTCALAITGFPDGLEIIG